MITEETRKKMSLKKIGNKNALGNRHPEWKKKSFGVQNIGRFRGQKSVHFIPWDSLTYGGKHIRIKVMWGKADCCEDENCKHISKMYHWANLSGQYKEDRSDWKKMCVKCHFKHDNVGEKSNRKAHKPVIQFDKDGNFIRTHKGIHAAANYLGIGQPSISNVLTGRSQTAGGFRWQYLS